MAAHPDSKEAKPNASENEFLWILQRFFLLLKYWTTPLDKAVAIPADEQPSVRAFALFLIVALTFSIRADSSGGTYAAVTAMAATVAAVLSAVLSTMSDQFNFRVREQLLISAYASTILVMFLYIVVDNYFLGMSWYEALSEQFGKTLVTVVLAAAISYVLLIAKAFLIDHHKFSVVGLVHGGGLVFCSGLIVLCISTLSTPIFRLIIQMLSRAVGQPAPG